MIWSLGQAVYNLLNLRTVQRTVNKTVKTFVCFTFEPYIKGVNKSKLIYYPTILIRWRTKKEFRSQKQLIPSQFIIFLVQFCNGSTIILRTMKQTRVELSVLYVVEIWVWVLKNQGTKLLTTSIKNHLKTKHYSNFVKYITLILNWTKRKERGKRIALIHLAVGKLFI